jgi:phenylpropionate dioxygenase-like ring-hydroxylating dioxygenase large terminal subunit
MLKHEDNERLVRVGPGTPTGELFRRYWQPALLSSELPEKDGAPVRVRILGEDLIAFRDTEGRVGLVDAFCPHRRAPMFYGRNEDCGLRCVYHGWKFDVTGQCVDLPTEPPDSRMKANVKIKSYPVIEKGALVWTYMGPPGTMPPPPDYEWLRVPPESLHVSRTNEACNYLQALEGGLDTAHSSYLHNNKLGDNSYLRTRDGAPKLEIEKTDYGYTYVSHRRADERGAYVRVYRFVMPAQQMRGNVTSRTGGKPSHPKIDGHVWVPMDDETTCVYNFFYGYDRSVEFSDEVRRHFDDDYGRGADDMIPGTFWLKRNLSNDHMIDRQVQKTQTFTGIKGINTQDFALQEGMGPIVDRSKEMLGSSDRAIVTMRRMLLQATAAVAQGERPLGVEPSTHCAIRPHDSFVPVGQTWHEAFADALKPKW